MPGARGKGTGSPASRFFIVEMEGGGGSVGKRRDWDWVDVRKPRHDKQGSPNDKQGVGDCPKNHWLLLLRLREWSADVWSDLESKPKPKKPRKSRKSTDGGKYIPPKDEEESTDDEEEDRPKRKKRKSTWALTLHHAYFHSFSYFFPVLHISSSQSSANYLQIVSLGQIGYTS